MAFPIIPIRNAVTTSEDAPLAGNLQLAELAVNTASGKLYFKGNSGVVEVAGGALTTNDLSQLAVAGKVPQLNALGQISTAQLQIATTAQLGVLSIDAEASNGLSISGAGAAKVIPGTTTIVGGVKASDSIAIALDGTATVQSAGTY